MRRAPKVAINLSARADIVREAKDLGLNLSEVFESAVVEAVRRRRQELWLEENEDAIEAYNARIERDGMFGDVGGSSDGPVRAYPFLLDVQADLLRSLASRVVVPLAPVAKLRGKPLTRLNPLVSIAGRQYAALFQELAAIPTKLLRTPVGDLRGRRAELIAARDLLFTGSEREAGVIVVVAGRLRYPSRVAGELHGFRGEIAANLARLVERLTIALDVRERLAALEHVAD